MRRFVIGTAGHVDHGKTTLVRALTGVDTDRLPEEKRRGISIELGFAPIDLGCGVLASLVDVPGHRRLVRTMIAGAIGMEIVLLVVAGDEGVMPQTREHVRVCELLGIRHAVVAVTKADAVEADLAAVAAEEARALLADHWSVEVVFCSGKTGEGVERVREGLRRKAAELPAPAPSLVPQPHARLGVDRVFSVHGAGTVVTGTLVQGGVATGESVWVVGERGPRAASVRALHVHGAPVARAVAPTRLAMNLTAVACEEVRRGDAVTSDADLGTTALLDVLVRGAHCLERGAACTVHVGTACAAGQVGALSPVAEGVVARVRLDRAIPLAGGDRALLRGASEGGAGAIAGGGVVVDAHPDGRVRGAAGRALAQALASLDPATTVRALVESHAPRPLARATLGARFALDAGVLARAADGCAAEGTLARVGDHGWVSRAQLDALAAHARELVRRHELEAPLARGLPLETLRARLSSGAGRLAAQEAIGVAATVEDARDRITIDGDVARMAQGESAAHAAAEACALGVERALREAHGAGATAVTLSGKTGVGGAELRALLQRLARDGRATRLGDLWLSSDVVDSACRRMKEHFAGARTLSVIEFKQMTGLARKQAVLILEHFDGLGLTRREGDARVLR